MDDVGRTKETGRAGPVSSILSIGCQLDFSERGIQISDFTDSD
jgi:hypothetical protein